MVDIIIRFAAYGPVLLFLWLAVAYFTAYRRTLYSQQSLLTGRLWAAFMNAFWAAYAFGVLVSVQNTHNHSLIFCIQLVIALLMIVLHFRKLKPLSENYRHPADVLLLRRPLPEHDASEVSRRSHSSHIVAGITLLLTLGSVLGMAARPCGWLDRTLQRSGCLCIVTPKASTLHDLEFSPDGKVLALAEMKQVRLWSVENRKMLGALPHPDGVKSVAFSPDGLLLASIGYDHTTRLWRIADGMLVRTFENNASMWDIDFSPDGTTLATSGIDLTELWRVADGVSLWSSSSSGEVIFSPDGKYLAINTSDELELWKMENLTLQRQIAIPDARLYSAAFSPDSTLIAAVVNTNDQIWLWSVDDSAMKHIINWPTDGRGDSLIIQTIAFSPDGESIAAAANDTVRVWRIQDEVESNWFETGTRINILTFAPDGTLATGYWNDRIALWQLQP